MTIRFEEPPPERRGGHGEMRDWAAIGAALKERPGEWALIITSDRERVIRSTAANIRRGSYVALQPTGLFEAVARKVGDEFRLYARYVGEPS